jgi:cob(I)alamin adenosyltransferase
MLRTAERRAVGLKDRDILPNLEVLRYLNRLADLLFMLARYEDRERPLDLVNKADRDKGLAE